MNLNFTKALYPEEGSITSSRDIGEFNTTEQMWQLISQFLTEHHFKSYYSSISFDSKEDRIWIDVGSHTEFFTVDHPTKEFLDEIKIVPDIWPMGIRQELGED